MESLLDSPVTLVPVLLALAVIAAIGAGVIVMTTLSSARQNRSLYAPVGSGQHRIPQADLPWDQRRSEPVPHVPEQDDDAQGSPRPGSHP